MLNLLKSFSLDQILSLTAILVSLISLIVSGYIAKKMLDIAKKDQKEKIGSIVPYLIDGITWTSPKEEKIVAFSCSIENPSMSPLSISRVNLNVHTNGTMDKRFQTVLELSSDEKPINQIKTLEIPINLGPRETISGWLIFKVPRAAHENLSIEKYEVLFTSSCGKQASFDQYILKKVYYENIEKS